MHDARILLTFALVLSLLSLALPACETGTHPLNGGDDDDDDDIVDDDDDDVADDDDAAPAEAAVSGAAGRTFSTCPPAGNGVGDLCMFLLSDCADPDSTVASAVVLDADMSWPDNKIDFTVEEVPDGVWQLYGFLDDDGSGCEGGISNGDFFLAGACVEVVVVDQRDVEGVVVTFDSKCQL